MSNCQKLSYHDRIAALLALSKVQHQDKSYRSKLEVRAYFCAGCRAWHPHLAEALARRISVRREG